MKIFKSLILTLIIILNISVPALAQRVITLKVDGKVVTTDVPPVINDGRTLIPARAVFEELGAKVEWDSKTRCVTIKHSDTVIMLFVDKTLTVVNSDFKELDVPAKIINNRTMIPVRFVAVELGMSVEWEDKTSTVLISTKKSEPVEKIYKLGEILVQDSEKNTTIRIKGVGEIKPSVMKLESPLRMVFDFKNSKLAGSSVTYKSENPDIKSIRTGQYEEKISRVVVDLEADISYEISASGDECIITFENKGKVEPEIGIKPEPETEDKVETKPEEKPEIEIKPEDEPEDEQDEPTETEGYISSIVLSEAAKEKLVFIDPGHGGSEVGTVGKWNGKEIYEKDINIKISKLVNEMLVNNGARTYMLRKSDEAMAVARRPEKANEMGAHFYMSIHNNAAENTSVKGVQICYADTTARFSQITNSRIANIYYENIASLGLRKAGLLNNPRYIVIYKADMPSIIVESAFVSNQEDLALLMDDSFIEKLAQKICDSTLEILNLSAESEIISPRTAEAAETAEITETTETEE